MHPKIFTRTLSLPAQKQSSSITIFHLIAHSRFICIAHSTEQANRGLKVLYSIVQIISPNHIGPKSQPATCLSPVCTLGQLITPRIPSLLFWVFWLCDLVHSIVTFPQTLNALKKTFTFGEWKIWKTVHVRLMGHPEPQRTLSHNQRGFQSYHSTLNWEA